MTALRRAAKKDETHSRLRSFWRGLPGTSWTDLTADEAGKPDALLGCNGIDQLVEVKSGSEQPRQEQLEWAGKWCGRPVVVVRETSQLRWLYRELRGELQPAESGEHDLEELP